MTEPERAGLAVVARPEPLMWVYNAAGVCVGYVLERPELEDDEYVWVSIVPGSTVRPFAAVV